MEQKILDYQFQKYDITVHITMLLISYQRPSMGPTSSSRISHFFFRECAKGLRVNILEEEEFLLHDAISQTGLYQGEGEKKLKLKLKRNYGG